MNASIFRKITLAAALCAWLGTFTWTALGGVKTRPSAPAEPTIDAAKLWADTCQQCHNLRPASAYSDLQLQVIVHHMRVRANLTGKESRAILEFLQQAN